MSCTLTPPDRVHTLEVVAELPTAPGNLTFTPEGRLIISLHQFYEPTHRVTERTQDGHLLPFPNLDWNDPQMNPEQSMHSVLGLQCDANGIVWMLDNAMFVGVPPKLIGWDIHTHSLARLIQLPAPITRPGQFVNDLAVDLTHNAIYIADPALDGPAALIVVDLNTGRCRRVLENHVSVMPEDIDVVIDGQPLVAAFPDGTLIPSPRTGVDAIALDAQNEWLYYGPLNGSYLYRIPTKALRDFCLSDQALECQVEQYSERPICDGISIDNAGNIYLGDLEAHTLGVITTERRYQPLITDERIAWLDSLSFNADGYLYFVSNQLHRSAPMNGGLQTAEPPFYIFRTQPLAPGVTGR